MHYFMLNSERYNGIKRSSGRILLSEMNCQHLTDPMSFCNWVQNVQCQLVLCGDNEESTTFA